MGICGAAASRGHQALLATTRSWGRDREPISCGVPRGANPARISTSHLWPPVPSSPRKLLHSDFSEYPVFPRAVALSSWFQSLTVSAVQRVVILLLTVARRSTVA